MKKIFACLWASFAFCAVAVYAINTDPKLQKIFYATNINYQTVSGNLIKLHNDARHGFGMQELCLDQRLMSAAQAHADYMAENETLTHYGPESNTVANRANQQQYEYMTVGENIASGQIDISQLMSEWMESQSHKLNILGPYVHIGVGVSKSKQGKLYWCVVFGKPLPT